jgi:GDP/UDP-N,N'-diacetylbacillosamine 2-epimerase (hydrolysing)
MKIGILTSSRADYGIYLPLLKKLKSDSFFSLEIIAFGTHLSKNHGFTKYEIEKDDYSVIHSISSLISNDDEQSIVTSYGLTILKFAEFWKENVFDLVFCLGDRFEMSAAIQAGIPFGVNFTHIHGGETTLGAIDNVYRHQITLASNQHFTSTEIYAEKISNLIESKENIYTVGSLSLDNIQSFKPINKLDFYKSYYIPDEEFALVTFHPETVSAKNNIEYAIEMRNALSTISSSLFVIITMPNADTLGSILRDEINKLKSDLPNRFLLIENFGKINYFSAMFYSKLLVGNTSSGILEAASFGKYVVNVGNRQKGRAQSENVLNCAFKAEEIVTNVEKAIKLDKYKGENIYFKEGAADTIIKIIKKI